MSIPINSRIEDEYRRIREENENLRKRRLDEVCEKIPEIEEIDDRLYEIRGIIISSLASRQNDISGLEAEVQGLVSKREQLLKSNGYPENYTSTIYTCQNCKDTGYVGTSACPCRGEKKIKYLYEYSNLSPLMKEQTFDKFNLNLYPDTQETMFARTNAKAILDNCKKFAELREWEKGKNLYIYGGAGVGKTFLCSSIATELIRQGVHVMYQTAYSIVSALEENRFKNAENGHAVDLYYSIPVLIIDDLGTEFSNTFTAAVLFDIINSRLSSGKSTVISSNLSMDELGKQYSPRVQSRIMGEYELMKLYGNDIRTMKLTNG